MRDQNKRLFRGKTVGRELLAFLNILRAICSVHGYPARRATSTVDPDDSQRLCSTIDQIMTNDTTQGQKERRFW